MKIIVILALVLISLILGWMMYPRFADSEAPVEKETGIRMIDEIVLGSIPATEKYTHWRFFSFQQQEDR